MNWNNSKDPKPGRLHLSRLLLVNVSTLRSSLSLLLIFALLVATLIPARLTAAERPSKAVAKAPTAQSETVTFYGPQRFERQSGSPITITEQFSIPAGVVAPFTLHLVNGAPDGTLRVSSATITLNGVELFTQNEIKESTPSITQ